MGVFALSSYLIAFIAAFCLPDATGADMTRETPYSAEANAGGSHVALASERQ